MPEADHSEPGIPVQTCPICGPTIVVSRRHQTGDRVYCRHCGGEAEVELVEGRIHLHPTGRKGSAADLEPEADVDVIHDLVVSAAPYLKTEVL